MHDRLEIGEKTRLSHHHRGFADDEAGPEPDHPGDTPRVRGDGNTITGRWIVASHSWDFGRSLPGPALMPGRRSGRARFALPGRHRRASFTRLLGVRLQPEGSSPHREKPRQETVPLLTPRPYEA